MPIDSDLALAQRMRLGDAAAFASLANRYWNAVHGIVSNMLSDQSKAGEVSRETFLRALRSPDWFPRDEPFKVSLYRLAIVLSLIQHEPRPAFGAESLLPQFDVSGRLVVPSQGGWCELAGRRGLAAQIREGLEHVDDLDRAAFVLREIEQVRIEEAAAILRTSREGIRASVHRAYLMLIGFIGQLRGSSTGPAELSI